jgi:hypothetical protein
MFQGARLNLKKPLVQKIDPFGFTVADTHPVGAEQEPKRSFVPEKHSLLLINFSLCQYYIRTTIKKQKEYKQLLHYVIE